MLDATPKIMDAWELAEQYNIRDLRERVVTDVSPCLRASGLQLKSLSIILPIHAIGVCSSRSRE